MDATVHYALVAFWEKSGCKIVADYPADQNPAYRAIALNTIDNLKKTEDEQISVGRDKYTIHVLIGELHYVCLTSKSDCPSSASRVELHSQIFLKRLRKVYRELPMLADLSRDLTNLAVMDFSKPLKQIIEEHNNQNITKGLIPKIEEDLTEIRHALMDGLQKLINRGQKLDELIQKTLTLQITSRKDFHVARTPRKKKKNAALMIIAMVLLMFASATAFVFLIHVGIL